MQPKEVKSGGLQKKSTWVSIFNFLTGSPIWRSVFNFFSGSIGSVIIGLATLHLWSGRDQKKLEQVWTETHSTRKEVASFFNEQLQNRKDMAAQPVGFKGLSSPQCCTTRHRATRSSTDPACLSAYVSMCGAPDQSWQIVIDSFKEISMSGHTPIILNDSRIVQTMVVMDDTILDRMQDLAEKLTTGNHNRNVILQLDTWGIIYRTDDGVQILKLEDTQQVPIILQSTYAAGKITIKGLHVTDAKIEAATPAKCLTLKTLHRKVASEVEVHMCTVWLPLNKLSQLFVYAVKPMMVNGHDISIHSFAVHIQGENLRTVLRILLPSAILITFAVKQLWLDGIQLIQRLNLDATLAWVLPLTAIYITQILPPSTENSIKEFFENIALAISTFYSAAQCTFVKEKPEFSTFEPHIDKSGSEVHDGAAKPTVESMSAEIWDVYDEYSGKNGKQELKKRCKDDFASKKPPFDVIYSHVKDLPWAQQVKVRFSSPSLIQVLRDLLKDYFDDSPKKSVPITDLFHIREKLKGMISEGSGDKSALSGDEDKVAQNHLSYLLRYMDQELEVSLKRYSKMKAEHLVSWDMLWAFFPSGEKLIYHCKISEEKLCGVIVRCDYRIPYKGPRKTSNEEPEFHVAISTWDYNCKTWNEYHISRSVDKFDGEYPFKTLKLYPLQFKDDPEGAEKGFVDKGNKFWELSMDKRSNYMNYRGPIFVHKREGGDLRISKENADGRVMIDLGSFAKMNPEVPLGTATPPPEVLRNNEVTAVDIRLRPDQMFAPAIVYGFSFRVKKWGCFSICGFDKIAFNKTAFDTLVMNQAQKDVVYSLVREQTLDGMESNRQDTQRVDSIVGKGLGCIFLCYGPPGTGKTLTAESVSEKLQRPLWSLSVSELGTTPSVLETMLVRIFDVAASWGAVLLLDEADIFMERRTMSSDLVHNAMTGIFLRTLEYQRGVLFLTSNRVMAFDEAFCSRITMFLYYEKHNVDQRRTIWKNLLGNVGMTDLPENNLHKFSEVEFNGREIRNVIQTAQTLAEIVKENLSISHLEQAVAVLKSALELLKANSHKPPNPTVFSRLSGFRVKPRRLQRRQTLTS